VEDGLYRISFDTFTAGFVVKDGKIVKIAPIIRKWPLVQLLGFAIRIGD
jgi:hypothetical protein